MEFSVGLATYLVALIVITIIAGARRLAWWAFFFGSPALTIASVLITSLITKGDRSAGSLMAFISLLVPLICAICLKSRAQKLADGDHVDGFKKCPACAEQVRAEATKCRYCSTELPQTS